MPDQKPASVTFRVQGKEPETLTDPHLILLRILDDYLKNPEMVRRIIADFRAQVLDQSDHSAYRELADAVTDSIIGDPNDWDGDASESELLVQYLKNVRDIARHEVAEEVRAAAEAINPVPSRHTFSASVYRDMANRLDPYQRGAEGVWIRKSDGTVVSWRNVKD